MIGPVAFATNSATAAAVASHLARNDEAFVPRLSERVDIPTYASRIVEHADRFEALVDGELVGLVAAYRDARTRTAFITNVSIDQRYRRLGLATELVGRCLAFAREERLAKVTLEVDPANRSAIALYSSHGFVVQAAEGPAMRMNLDLGENNVRGLP